MRFLYYQISLRERLGALRHAFEENTVDVEQNIELSELDATNQLEDVTSHIFRQMKILTKKENAALVLSVDGPREQIHKGQNPYTSRVYKFNRMTIQAAGKLDIPIVDLTRYFLEDFAQYKKPFNSSVDGHWNEHGHTIVAAALGRFLLNRDFL